MTFEEFMHESPSISSSRCDRALRIGVVGYSDDAKIDSLLSDRDWVRINLVWAINQMKQNLAAIHGVCDSYELVSGLTDTGIPSIAYDIAKNDDAFLKTIGFACSKAKDFPQFPVDKKYIIGNNWGEESNAFLEYVDCIIRIGDGKQSIEECNRFKEKYPDKPIVERTDSDIKGY